MSYEQENTFRSRTASRVDAAAIDQGLRTYMLRVYNYMAMGIAVVAIVSLYMMSNPPLMESIFNSLGGWGKWILFAVIIGMGFFSNTLTMSGNTLLAQGSFWAYAALWGIWISPMVYKFVSSGNEFIVFQAFAITSVAFLSLSIYGYTAKRDLSALGAFCCMAAVGLFLVGLTSIFFGGFGQTFSLIFSCLVVLVIAGMTAWETQEIKQLYLESDDPTTTTGKAIFGAFHLMASFVIMFIHILNILGIMGGDD